MIEEETLEGTTIDLCDDCCALVGTPRGFEFALPSSDAPAPLWVLALLGVFVKLSKDDSFVSEMVKEAMFFINESKKGNGEVTLH